MIDKYIDECPYCGDCDMIEAHNIGSQQSIMAEGSWHSVYKYYTICRTCGSILREYVKDPEKLVPKAERKNKPKDLL